MLTQKQPQAVIASADDITYAIESIFSSNNAIKAANDYMKTQDNGTDAVDDSNLDINSAPIVKLVTSLIESGVRMKASDIHIEPEATRMRVRMRVDGILHETFTSSNKPHNALVSRIKIMSNLNIAEKRIPQDGRILTQVDGREIDLRVATMPSTQGEKVVIRILDRESLVDGVQNLGLGESNTKVFNTIVKKPHGMVFVTGPTGSGKTTTLYTVLSSLNNIQRNIVTIEDPVEYDIPGITQTQINPKAGLTFATGLRAFMRGDPDVIMVGEVRDEETADVAVNAALTGHLVLSTLHTNDSVGAIARLHEMGVKPYIIASSLSGVVAQRLVRKICPHCKTSFKADNEMKRILEVSSDRDITLYKGTGCDICNKTGYKGRIGVFEVLEVDKEIRELIIDNASTDRLHEVAVKNGMLTLEQDAMLKVLSGITTLDELLRIKA
jgi:type IV pilus assembly protein PilB